MVTRQIKKIFDNILLIEIKLIYTIYDTLETVFITNRSTQTSLHNVEKDYNIE